MPKIIPELREKILLAAKKRLKEDEKHDFSTRQLAKDLDIAAGTIFNYFSTKEEILAYVMLEDWQKCLGEMRAASEEEPGIREGFTKMEALLRSFSVPYRQIWSGYDHLGPVRERHGELIRQITAPVRTMLERFGKALSETELGVLSEMLLTASQREEGTLERIFPVMEKIFT